MESGLGLPNSNDAIFLPRNQFLWSVLAFQGGLVNVGGLMAVNHFVSHVTGFAGHFAQFFAQGRTVTSLFALLVPLFFLTGAFFSAIFTELYRREERAPIYSIVTMTIGSLFLFTSVTGDSGWFGTFGKDNEDLAAFALIAILSFCCGAQNALFTHYSRSVIRTTHLTGLMTDLGIGLARQLYAADRSVRGINWIRLELIVSFLFGSLVGAYLFLSFEFLGFLAATVISYLVSWRLYASRTQSPQ